MAVIAYIIHLVLLIMPAVGGIQRAIQMDFRRQLELLPVYRVIFPHQTTESTVYWMFVLQIQDIASHMQAARTQY